jgi:transcriptional regulator with XRE-family HTH domain
MFLMKDDTQLRSDFARNLIAIRKEKGVSQRDLAQRTGISNRMVAYYETNAVIPPLDKLEKIAKALGVSISRLTDSSLVSQDAGKLDTRTMKKVHLIEQLPPAEQKKVMEYAKDLLEKVSLKQLQNN